MVCFPSSCMYEYILIILSATEFKLRILFSHNFEDRAPLPPKGNDLKIADWHC